MMLCMAVDFLGGGLHCPGNVPDVDLMKMDEVHCLAERKRKG